MIDYDPHAWSSHLWDVRGTMLKRVLLRVIVVGAWSASIVLSVKYIKRVDLTFPPTLHTLVGGALGLLLVFRTNTAYDRFWEGRRMWGGIINTSRDLGRGASAHLRSDPERRDHIIRWTIAYSYAVMNHLRKKNGLGPIADHLPTDETQAALESPNVPLAVSIKLTGHLADARSEGKLSDHLLVAMDQHVQLLTNYTGGCERISRTPLPFAYVVHLRRALLLFCLTLPFALAKDFGWGAIFDTMLISYIFFGIEEIGVEIENPFGKDANDLPLERFCETIRTELMSIDCSSPLNAPSPAHQPFMAV